MVVEIANFIALETACMNAIADKRYQWNIANMCDAM